MIDREGRNHVAAVLRSYMDEEITAFDFDSALDEVIDAEDETLDEIRRALWFCYDDNKDHKVVATKELWDCLNRILLLLESQAEIIKKSRWQWHLSQAIAAACLILFSIIVWKFGLGQHLLVFAMPFGFVSMLITWKTTRTEISQRTQRLETTPFPSIASLLAVHRQVPDFHKRQYSRHIGERKIRGPIIDFILLLKFRIMWLMFAPLPLFFQMFPKRETTTIIKLPESVAGCHAYDR